MNNKLQDGDEDDYGNIIGGDLIHCCFPDCGCDGARLCMAKNGASERACNGNIEGMWGNGSDPKCAAAVFKLMGEVNKHK